MNQVRFITSTAVLAVCLAGCGGSSPSTRLGEPGPWEVQVISNGDTTAVPTLEAQPASAVSYQQIVGVDTSVPEGEWFTETSVEGMDEGSAFPVVNARSASAQETPSREAKSSLRRTMDDFTYGYRIQISANEGSMVLAEARAAEADSLYPIPAYVEYEQGWYKVRLGDFITRGEAETYMVSAAIKERYDKAFITETYVLKPD